MGRILIVLFIFFYSALFAQLKQKQAEKIYIVVERNPKFPGGQAAMYAWLGKRLEYPNKQFSYPGKLFISFVVNKYGHVTDVKLLKINEKSARDYEDKVVKIFTKMPRWTPGYQGGKPVSVRYNLPINLEPE